MAGSRSIDRWAAITGKVSRGVGWDEKGRHDEKRIGGQCRGVMYLDGEA